jgi:general secretion pathway protein H
MRTLAAGNKRLPPFSRGFTLVELLVVIALIAALQRDAERLAALLESARAQARAQGVPVVWHSQMGGTAFEFAGLPPPGLPRAWLNTQTRAAPGIRLTLGPDPLIEPQAVALSSVSSPGRTLWVVTDGLRPFKVQSTPNGPGAQP